MDHYYETLPGWAAFSALYVEMAAKAKHDMIYVEVGSWLGRSAALMAVGLINSGMRVEFVCIDPWLDGGPDLKDTAYFKSLTKPVFETFMENIRPVRHMITALRMTSVEGARRFADGQVDFLMLDGDHSYEAVKADIAAWLPKMKKGSVISGDDYLWPGVKKAVDQAFGNRAITVIKKANPNNPRTSVAYWWVQL